MLYALNNDLYTKSVAHSSPVTNHKHFLAMLEITKQKKDIHIYIYIQMEKKNPNINVK